MDRTASEVGSGAHRVDVPGGPGRLLGGGIDGNELLTAATGVVLIVVLAALGLTIVAIGRLLWEHLFIGLLLIGPVVLKLASTGYRFVKYYAGDPVYVRRGPPWTPLRLIAPVVVASTVVVFATGVVLLFVGPAHRDPWLLAHKASFILWLVVTALHVLGHIPEVGRLLGVRSELIDLPGIRTDLERHTHERGAGLGDSSTGRHRARVRAGGGPGWAGRALALGLGLGVGVVLALLLVPDFHTWTAPGMLLQGADH